MLALSVAFTAVALAAPSAQSAATRGLAPLAVCPGQAAATATAAVQAQALRCLINWARRHAGVGALRDSAELDRSAAMRARDIRRCQDFSHTPCGQSFATVFTAVHYLTGVASVGENLQWGQGSLGTPRAAMASWLGSAPHRANIYAARWRDLGIARIRGTMFGRSNVTVWVAQFGRRAVVTP